ncbi:MULTISPECIES: carboxylesterase/lipase family protein [Streptomyces]|uniref:Carboxylic ester hydrolase n=2 Tax=Streptomyces TaxID=1883 RepID=A0A0W7XBW2_9ACTN|nr:MULTISPECIES: carboxylesterase family protein [Streptomyces]KUF20430.1 carboxylesterase [Streptomyces silvensis]MVO90455.1 carboxylesterase family protein [Streptomyces typhae]
MSHPAPVARTPSGDLRGTRETQQGRTLAVFRGIPYAEPPTGPLRFASPRPPRPWPGVRDATRYGPAFVQSAVPGSAEDALYANVWTPALSGRRPVLVYFHGGGWHVGAGSAPTFDGARPAARGDLVVVNFNYRLGAFGWGLHEDLTDPETGTCANWGLQDQLALLRWVRENAASFGGDPDAVTLCGTSAGGATARQLALLPAARGLFARLITISAPSTRAPACSLTPDDATAVYEALAKECGTSVTGLREVPAARVHRAWLDFFAAPPTLRAVASGREYRGPVRDGRTVPAYTEDLPVPAVPVMSVHNHTEGSFFTDPLSPSFPPAPPAPTDGAELLAAVHDVLLKCAARVPDGLAADCVRAYRRAAADEGLPDDPRALWTEVWGDALFRHPVVRQAERHAREGRTPQYVMEFAHPVRPPHHGTPHDATSKFLFGTHGHPLHAAQFGDGPAERLLSDTFVDLVSSFVHGAVPSSPHAPAWPVFAPEEPTTLILGGPGTARLGRTPKLRQLGFWDGPGRCLRP